MFNILLIIGSTIRKPIVKLINRWVSQSAFGKKAITKRDISNVRQNRIIGTNCKYFFISFEVIRHRIVSFSVRVKSNRNLGFTQKTRESIIRLTTIQLHHRYRTLNNSKDMLKITREKKAFVKNSNEPVWIIRLFRDINPFVAVIAIPLLVPIILAHLGYKAPGIRL